MPPRQASRDRDPETPQPIPILFFTVFRGFATGGPTFTRNLLLEIDRERLRPILVSNEESPLTDEARRLGIDTVVVALDSELTSRNRRLMSASLAAQLRGLGNVLRHNREIARIAKQHRVQVFWGSGIRSIALIALAAFVRRAPLVWNVGFSYDFGRRAWLPKLVKWVCFLLCRVVVTEASNQPPQMFGRFVCRAFPGKFVTLPPGIAAERMTELTAPRDPSVEAAGRFRVLHVGSIHANKNQLMLVRALPGLVEAHPEIQVDLAGPVQDEAFDEQIRRFVAEHKLEDHVRLLGWRDDVPQLMSESDVLVICSNSEGIPNAVREAMYARLPVVATAVGGLPEIVSDGETGLLVPKGDSERLREALALLVDDPERRRAMGLRAREIVEQRYSLAAWARGYNDLFARLALKRR